MTRGLGKNGLRARDTDRAIAVTELDSGYADGQLTFDEHRARAAAANSAGTLAELHALVADLQLDSVLPQSNPVPHRKRRARWGLAGVLAVVVAIGAVVLMARDEDREAEAPRAIPAGDVVPIVAVPFDFRSAAGLSDFRRRYVARFGDPTVLSVYIDVDDERASIDRPTPEGRVQSIQIQGGFDPSVTTSPRDDSDVTIDWNQLDTDALAAAIAEAPATIGRPDAVLDTLNMRNFGQPEVRIDVQDSDGRVGTVVVDLAGNVMDVQPA